MNQVPLYTLVSEISSKLETAIDTQDWQMVCEVFYALTGVNKEIPHDASATVDQVREEVLSSIMSMFSGKKPKTKKAPKKQKLPSNVSNSKQTQKSNGKVNKFETMQDSYASEAFKDSGFDKINDNVTPAERTRKAFSMQSIRCNECGRNNEVHPMFAKEHYVCDRCLGRRV